MCNAGWVGYDLLIKTVLPCDEFVGVMIDLGCERDIVE